MAQSVEIWGERWKAVGGRRAQFSAAWVPNHPTTSHAWDVRGSRERCQRRTVQTPVGGSARNHGWSYGEVTWSRHGRPEARLHGWQIARTATSSPARFGMEPRPFPQEDVTSRVPKMHLEALQQRGV